MADLATNLNLISQSQAQKEVTCDGLLDAMSVASYWGRDDQACAALTWGYYGFVLSGVRYPNGTLALDDNSTCYVRLATSGTGIGNVDFVTAEPSGWPASMSGGDRALYQITTSGGLVTNYLDLREGATGSGGSSSVTLTGDVTGTGTGSFATTIANNAVSNAKAAQMTAHTYKGNNTGSTANAADVSAANLAADLGTNVKSLECLIVACTDELTPITAGTGKVTFRMPYAFTLSTIRASLTTAQATGSIFTVNVKESGTTILSTDITIDNTEKTSTTAATPAVVSDSSFADDAEMTVDVVQIGDGTATGLKVYLIGNRT